MSIREQIEQLRATKPIDKRNASGWDDLSSVRLQIADTMTKMLAENEQLRAVVEAADTLAKVFRSEIERAKGAELVAQVLNDFYRERKALAALEQETDE